jgi:serine/threonine-protein kinase
MHDRDAVGQVFLGRYQVLEPLGMGGMGTVFKGYDPKLQRFVALKTLHLDRALARDDASEQLSSLLREAVTVARFSHANIVAVYDLEDLPDAAFVAMEFVDGRSLERHLMEARVMTPDQAVPLAAAVARGLAAAHAQQVIHRDVKPANVLLGRDGSIKIADFGIAGALSRLAQNSDMVWGTPGYLPPEALKGEGQTERGDLFALGVILHECLLGANPFEGRDVDEMVRRSLEDEAPPLRTARGDVPPELEALVTALLQKEPERRPESAGHVADRLERMAVEREWRWSPSLGTGQVFGELPSKTFSMMIRRGAGGSPPGATIATGSSLPRGQSS